MAKDHKAGVRDALNKFYQRQAAKDKPKESRAHYGKPEKEVEKACLEWMRAKGWSVQILEAKATWSPQANRWLQQSMKAGTCDCMGNTDTGIGVAVEFKAPGRLSSINTERRYAQRKFIVDKINTNTFACVVDSVQRLETIWSRWNELREKGALGEARNYLISMLPQVSEKTRLKDEKLFDE